MIWGIQAKFPVIAPILEYLRNSYSSTHRGPWYLSKVSFDMKQGAEDFDYFWCVTAHDLGYSGPVFPNCSNNQVSVKQV